VSELPSGEQFEIRSGEQTAVVTEVGAALREYRVGGRPVIDGFDASAMADGSRGQPLLPWPNRVLDGAYEFDGVRLQLPIEEVGRHNAIHGLTRWVGWRCVVRADDRVTLGTVLHPRPGYPFVLQLEIEYALSADGLTVRTVARNVGERALPFGAGQHPYLCVGTESIDAARLQVEAVCRLELDPERRVPTGRTLHVAQTEYDFRSPRAIGGLVLDDCFGELERDEHGIARVVLRGEYEVTLWMGGRYRYLQLFTGDTLAPGRRRRSLAVEPLTCPPNAFRTGHDLIVLQAGEATTLAWGLSA
jgi:aldose 1-epimerase